MTQKDLNGGDGPSDDHIALWSAVREQTGLSWQAVEEQFPPDMEETEAKGWRYLARDGYLSQIDIEAVETPLEVHWWFEEGATPEEAIGFQGLGADEIPIEVARACKPLEEWSNLDPTKVEGVKCASCGDRIYHVEHEESCWMCGWDACYVAKDGEVIHGEYCNDPGSEGLYDYDEDSSGVMCGYCYESFRDYGDTVVVATTDGVFRATYQGSVVDRYEIGYDAPPYVEEIIEAIVVGTRKVRVDGWRSYSDGPAEAANLVKLGGGWHSSMERSDFSDAVNDITSGKLHSTRAFRVDARKFTDAVLGADIDQDEVMEEVEVEAELDFPVAVVFGKTSNVCSVGLDIYAPEDRKETLAAILDATAAPGYAGVDI